MEVACGRMSPQKLRAYKGLANAHQTDGSGPLHGIFRTNGLGLGLDDEEGVKFSDVERALYSCVGAEASRFNHR